MMRRVASCQVILPVSVSEKVVASSALVVPFEQIRHASKIMSGYARNQSRKKKTQQREFYVFLDTPVKKGELLKDQRPKNMEIFNYWKYNVGENVRGEEPDRKIYAEVDGVIKVRQSRVNPKYKWLDVDPDIQQHHRSNLLREEYQARGERSWMTKHNERYREEMYDLEEPEWRQRVDSVTPLTQRFPDPNLLTRGKIHQLVPMPRFTYE